MNQFALWMNTTTFAVSAASLVLAAGSYSRRPAPWMKSYLLYHAAYSLWLLIFTYYFFRLVYLPDTPPALDLSVAGLRLAVSGAILWAYPSLVMQTIGDGALNRILRIVRIVLCVVIVLPASILVAIGGSGTLLSLVTLFFNGSLLLLTVMALVKKVRGGPKHPAHPVVIPLLWISVGFYAYALVAGSLLTLTGMMSLWLSALSASLYCLPWSILVGWRLFTSLADAPTLGMRSESADRFALTPRERDVVEHVMKGLPNKHIAKELGVSLRTVETHLYNVFRKCGVRSRTELIRKIQSDN